MSAQVVGAVVPMPKSQWFDNNGDPLNGGKITSYQCGTTTPLSTYSDSALSVPNANPTILDTAGRAVIYLSATCYKFVVQTSASVTLYTQDNIYPQNYLASGTASSGAFLRGDSTWARATTVVTTTSTGTQNNFNPGTGIVGDTVILANNAALLTITGFSPAIAPWDGQQVWVISKGAGEVDLPHQNASSTAAFRLLNVATTGVTPLAGGTGSALYVYDASTARWKLHIHEQGAWITPTYAGGTYTGTGCTWTVDSGDVTATAYHLVGKTLDYVTVISTSSTSSAACSGLNITLPNSYTTPRQQITYAFLADNAVRATGFVQTAAAGTIFQTVRQDGANFAAAANTTQIAFTIHAEVN